MWCEPWCIPVTLMAEGCVEMDGKLAEAWAEEAGSIAQGSSEQEEIGFTLQSFLPCIYIGVRSMDLFYFEPTFAS